MKPRMHATPMLNRSNLRSVAAGLLSVWLLFGGPAESLLAQLPANRPAIGGNPAANPQAGLPRPGGSNPAANTARGPAAIPVVIPVVNPTPGSASNPALPPSPAASANGISRPPAGTPLPAAMMTSAPASTANVATASAMPMDPEAQRRARIKDVASIEGIRDNQLVGYGVVVGLRGTGDTQQTIFPMQSLLSILLRMGVNVPQTGTLSAQNMQVKNMAAVFLEATLPPFSHTGERIDVTISSAGDARSLEGGVLLLSPLYGPDGQIYAQAEGPLVIGGYRVSAGFNTTQVNYPTTARIPGGALVERTVPFSLKQLHRIDVELQDADFHTADRMAQAIDVTLGAPRAHVVDSRTVELIPQPGEDLPELLDRVESTEIDVYPRARVVVNERTGTVVIGGKVRLQPVQILHGGLSVNVVTEFQVSQPNAFGQGTTQVVPQTSVQANDRPVNRIELKQGATVEDLVSELQKIGATARDVISILQAMKAAGALEADLEVL